MLLQCIGKKIFFAIIVNIELWYGIFKYKKNSK